MTERPAVETAAESITEVIDRVGSAVVADEEFLRTVLAGLFANGHVLLEDVPGTGKTLTARVTAQALGLEFNRIQFTPDLLPTDVTGSNIYNKQTGSFEFQPGPVFANVVLADEINRAPPKTQAALLEAMEEKQVSVDGTTHDLPDPFVVIATQNPVEQEGTFPLPEAQRDRFIVKTGLGYPDEAGELELVDRRASRTQSIPDVDPVTTTEEVRELQRVPEHVEVEARVRTYLVRLARATRSDERVEVGVSPRGIQQFFEVARAVAMLNGRPFVAPDDVKAIAHAVMEHRIVLTAEADIGTTTATDVVTDVLSQVPVPGSDP